MMGSGDWFKTIISRKKSKQNRSRQAKGNAGERSNPSKWRNHSHNKVSNASCNGASSGNPEDFGLPLEDTAARRIQTAFRGFRARKALRRLKGLQRLKVLSQGHSIKQQTSNTLSHIQSWRKIQSEIKARRVCMVSEGRIKQKRQENQLKLEAELHGIEADWCGGSETKEEVLSKIQQREEAAVKRERALAYAFSHQWRANSGHGHSSYELGKGNWGWSWVERWIAARPWDTRLVTQPTSPNKVQPKAEKKINANASRAKKTSSKAIDEKSVIRESSSKPAVIVSHPKTKMKQEQQFHPPQSKRVTV